MSIVIRHLTSLLIAVVALAMSASLTLGAAAPQSSFAHLRAVSQAGTTAGAGDEVTAGEDEETETDEETDEESGEPEDLEEEGDGGDNCTTDPTDPATDLTTLTHGQIVCWAAQQETPEGYANHGAWVSEWAKGEHGNAGASQSRGTAKGHN
jgi:hypothetical protein